MFVWICVMKSTVNIGTSGWSYKDWVGIFYPEKLPAKDFLSFYAQYFNSVEINSSFYHLPRGSTVIDWTKKVPKDFLFCPKMSRFITHIKRLKEPEEPLQRFFETFAPMKKCSGPILIQLPPSLKFDAAVAEHFFSVLKTNHADFHFAIEVRHQSWLSDESIQLLKKFKIAWVISQAGVDFPYAEHITSKNIYVRFHGPGKLYTSSYSDKMLESFAGKFKSWLEEKFVLWIFFNNDFNGIGIENATRLKRMMGLEAELPASMEAVSY